MLFVTAVRVGSYATHDRIVAVKWLDCSDGKSGESTVHAMVEWLEKGNSAFVADSDGPVRIGVVKAQPPHLRTYRNEDWTDNLLHLPRL